MQQITEEYIKMIDDKRNSIVFTDNPMENIKILIQTYFDTIKSNSISASTDMTKTAFLILWLTIHNIVKANEFHSQYCHEPDCNAGGDVFVYLISKINPMVASMALAALTNISCWDWASANIPEWIAFDAMCQEQYDAATNPIMDQVNSILQQQ
jgi:hypothetical protein